MPEVRAQVFFAADVSASQEPGVVASHRSEVGLGVDLSASRGQALLGTVLRQLALGRTIRQIATELTVSEGLVEAMCDHLKRLGLVDSAGSLCASGLGACSKKPSNEFTAIACAGCPLAI